MHDPYEWYPLLKPNTQIDSIAAYDNYFLCGTKQGDLIMYSVVCKNSNKKAEVQLLRYNKNFYRKPIQQLSVIPQFNILIILADSTIFIHNLSSMNFPLISTLQKTKGATLFTVDIWNQSEKSLTNNQTYMVRLCVAVKRKIQLFYWKNTMFHELGDDIIVPDIPKSIALCKQSICVGFKGEYALINLDDIENNRKVVDLFPTGKNLEPNVIQMNDSIFALIRDNQSVFVDVDGKVLTKTAVKWSELPSDVAYDEPYLVSLLSETIEVRSMQPSLLVQQIPIPGAQLICRCSTGILYVLAGRQVFRVQATPVDKQIKMLVDQRQFQLAVKLCNILEGTEEEKAHQRYHIQTLYAYDLFHNKQFQESMKQFLELDTDPHDVIRLYPALLPQSDDGPRPESQPATLQNRDSDKSLQALIDYLTVARLKLKNNAELEKKLKIIDTTLLKCYLNTNDALIAPLLRLNNCQIEDSEKILKKHRKYSELIILYQTKGFHQKALELLEKQAENADSPLRGADRTIQYLQNLGKDYIDIILRYSTWVLKKYPDEGLKIFIEDLTEVEQLPRQKVLEHLQKTSKSLIIPYLEHVIYVWNDKTPRIHNALAHQYREKFLQLCNPSCSSSEHVVGQNIRTKLINFLEKSECYTAETVLSQFPFDSLHEERAVLYGKLKQHNQALAIYVIILGDVDKAIQYCDQVFERDGADTHQVYISLLQLLINPSDNWLVGVSPPTPPQPDIESALSLLEGNAEKIQPELAVPLLPKDIPIHRIKHYLTASFSNHLNKKRKSQILRGLLYAEYLQVQGLRIRLESENMLISERDICPVCKKRFSNQSAFIRNPNGDVTHFSCQKET